MKPLSWLGVIVLLVVLVAIGLYLPGNSTTYDEVEVQYFSSQAELEAYLAEAQSDDTFYYATRGGFGADVAMAESAPTAGVASKDGASDYSTTNIQVEGVDEPDFIKNDGQYIYVVAQNVVYVVAAYPAEDMEIISQVNLSGQNTYVHDLFLTDDQLIVFSRGSSYIGDTQPVSEAERAIGIAPDRGRYRSVETVTTYDISNKATPKLLHTYELEGNYLDARLKDGHVYVFTQSYVYGDDIVVPFYAVDGEVTRTAVTDIAYFPYRDSSYAFSSVSAIDLEGGDMEQAMYLLGASHTLYVSENAAYFTQSEWMDQEDYYDQLIRQVVLPLLPGQEADEVEVLLEDDDLAYYERYEQVGDIVYAHSRSLEGDEKEAFDAELYESFVVFEDSIAKERVKTVVHKVRLDRLSIEYEGNGAVPGTVLNQFSMDEYRGDLRIATTTGEAWSPFGGGEVTSSNHLYILNHDLELIGSVEDLAPGERIYSARFMGERAYMVTFRQVDPLYVIDTSDPTDPEVLGYLKVTGYSSYLHPYDESTLIGVGKEVDEQTGRTQGVKISVFDVSDVANPSELAKYEITDGDWSNSEALYDHKAFLFDRERNLLVIPVSYNKRVEGEQYRYEYWDGAYVFDISKDAISLRGTIAHERGEQEEYYYSNYANVRRSLFMDEVLYTISDRFVKANDLSTLEDVGEVALPYDEPDYYYYADSPTVSVAVDSAIEE